MKYFIFINLLFISTFISAATSNQKNVLWEVLEATPKKTSILDDVVDATNLNDVVEATGRKLDYDRTPLDNKVYKARVNPRIPETKKAMGNTAMKKLLKTSGWGYAATVALESLLNGIDWVIDPESQSIWRYKRSNNWACKNFGYKWKYSQNILNCPSEVLAYSRCTTSPSLYSDCYIKEIWADQYHTTKVSDLPKDAIPERIDVEIASKYAGQTVYYFLSVYKDKLITETDSKEVMTEDDLADYMLGTHKDFKDEKYKKDLPKPNTWTSVANVFKPENKFEEENSPTVKVVTTHLDQTNPESEDVTISPDKDPEGNPTGGFTLPSFCSWATTVCEFIGWVKEDTEIDHEEPEQPDLTSLDRDFDTTFSANASCPPNPVIEFPIVGNVELPFNKICDFFAYLKFGVLTASSLIACWIISAAVRGAES